ncbi:isocitrate lyase/PEP mutase family protein [Nonomuraea jabiensis]|uniref:2-methylisocitrate lyase-like PEP mutase family enzyme n=1 Tax=Nonomuraea jabiensis TaxID=882448 RepID=A0A7W9LE32_9ACTN|nr:isocitrate lyase/phosphoenolpyruvate mutase family protein [Nonomuraea jabiensis]MBB5780416.1 2-methylisocitrate lyase-like PEP mutase family enzyme [Nonomuraea jabiensis]
MTPTTVTQAARFRDLHEGTVLVLPNAWDAASAALIEAAGAQAIATTSAGVSWANGAPDAEGLGRERMVAAVSAVVAAVTVPVTADIEGGYGDVAGTVRAVIEAGAVGVNLEDSPGLDGAPLLPPADQARRIAAARAAADAAGVELFVNARTDVYLAGVPGDRLAEVEERARVYAEAGADGLFVPGLLDLAAIARLAGGPLPLNVMAGPGAPPVERLAAAGVARVSVGSAIAQAAYACAARAAAELLDGGTYAALADGLDYGGLNALLRR